jgi:phosphatidylinositol-bisphosphatase
MIALWRFVPKVEESRVCKRWITFDQNSGLLLPGETTNIVLTVLVDKKTAQLLNSGRDVSNNTQFVVISNILLFSFWRT